jgi:aspartyl-tRNA(Asn)/glutamyl-tRNA(Gln) amidotransferase subunit C
MSHYRSPHSAKGSINFMRITLAEVQRIATLARLALTPTEEQDLVEHFERILTYVDTLKAVDTTGIKPMAHAIEVAGPFREDRVTNRPDPETLLSNAPTKEGHFFKVPKILD